MEKIFEFNTNYKPEIDNYSSKLEEQDQILKEKEEKYQIMKEDKALCLISTPTVDIEHQMQVEQVNKLLNDVNEWVAINSNWLSNGTKSKIKEATYQNSVMAIMAAEQSIEN